jgi:hypothetical protein
MADETARDHRPDWMETKFEGCGDAEIVAAASNGPEQVGIIVLARMQNAAIRGDQPHRSEVVECER